MAPIGTFGANHELVAALNRHGVRYLVVGGAATKHYVAERQSEHPGELDVLVEPTIANAEKVIAALRSIGFASPDWAPERLAKPWCQLRVDNGYYYADILTPHADEDFAAYRERALDETIGYERVKVIANEDQQAHLAHSPMEKHKRDIELLKAAVRNQQPK
ncbi:MAG TPA: hypothetical protein VEO73_09100 [Gemmatimonadales bacterium]|nr:hypothetical protein [Gemmatimonadales bacterium]